MDVISGLYQGFAVAFDPINLLYCFIGVFIGTLVGVLPGIGPISAMSLLLPVTLSGSPESGIIMMAGIYYGSMYGGSTTSILVNIPGRSGLGGHLHRRPRDGQARPGRPGTRHLGAGFVRRRHLRDRRPDARGADAGPGRRRLRPAGIFQPDGARPHHPVVPDAGLDGKGAADGMRSASCSAWSASTRSTPCRDSPSTASNWSTASASCQS
jgi:hypothetical protein